MILEMKWRTKFWKNRTFKGIVSDSNNIFLWHKSEDINKKGYFQTLRWFQFYIYKLCMIMCVCTAPYLIDENLCEN